MRIKSKSDGGKSDRFLNDKLDTRMIALAKCTILIRLRSAALDTVKTAAMRLIKGNDRAEISMFIAALTAGNNSGLSGEPGYGPCVLL
jgi:hypothetical protein